MPRFFFICSSTIEIKKLASRGQLFTSKELKETRGLHNRKKTSGSNMLIILQKGNQPITTNIAATPIVPRREFFTHYNRNKK
jgi:hypothetical protein